MEGYLEIYDCDFNSNFIYFDTIGVYASHSTLWIKQTQMKDEQRQNWYDQLENRLLGDMSGAFVNIGTNSTVYISNSHLEGGRATYGGCISI